MADQDDGRDFAGAVRAAALVAVALLAGDASAGDGRPGTKPGAPPQQPDTSAAFASEVAKAEEPFIPKLEALGQWCEQSTLFIERAHVAETLLVIDPENERGRKWLRWTRQKDGTWKETKYANDLMARELADGGYDWVESVRRLVVEKGVSPNLPVLMGTPLNSMTRDDGLMAYGLAAYFLGGRPDDLREILARHSHGEDFNKALAETCGLDGMTLELRFIRWLRETK